MNFPSFEYYLEYYLQLQYHLFSFLFSPPRSVPRSRESVEKRAFRYRFRGKSLLVICLYITVESEPGTAGISHEWLTSIRSCDISKTWCVKKSPRLENADRLQNITFLSKELCTTIRAQTTTEFNSLCTNVTVSFYDHYLTALAWTFTITIVLCYICLCFFFDILYYTLTLSYSTLAWNRMNRTVSVRENKWKYFITASRS